MSGTKYVAALTYNVCSLLRAGRVHDVSDELKRIHLVGLQGTRIKRHAWDADHCAFNTNDHLVINSGYGRSAYTNKSCGVTLMLTRKWFSKNSILHYFKVPASLQGRCMAVLLRFFGAKILLINVYFPPPTSMSTSGYQKCIDAIIRWINSVYEKCKEDVTPIFFTDLNDGMVNHGDEDYVVQYSNPRGEGYAGQQLHALFECRQMSIPAYSKYPIEPTFLFT